MEAVKQQSETGCCPRFEPGPWDAKEVKWQDKLFVKDSVRSFLHMPLNFGGVMKKNMAKIESAGAVSPENITLSDEKSLWGSDVYIAVNKEVAGAKMEKLSGAFVTKVFEGPYKNMGKWVKEMHSYAQS